MTFSFLIAILFVVVFISTVKKETFLPIYSYIIGENDRLYRLLELTTSIFRNEKIPHSITGNILFSAATVEKLQRGDSTATLLIPINYIPKVLELSESFLKAGVGFNDLPDGSLLIGSSISLSFTLGVSIHIIPVELAGDKWIVSTKRIGYEEWYGKDDLFPTKGYTLGNFTIQGPQNPLPYLQRNYWSGGNFGNGGIIVNSGLVGNNGIATKVRIGDTMDIRDAILVDQTGLPILIDKDISFYGSNRLQAQGKKMILMGNGKTLLVPSVGPVRPRNSGWRRFLWS